jgi:hypothetical protein
MLSLHSNETARRVHAPSHHRIDFVLCPSCFWCASYFDCSGGTTRCLGCGSNNVESLPISNGEVYTFSLNRNRGVTLHFSKNRGFS